MAEGAVMGNLEGCDIKPCIRGGILVRDSYFDSIDGTAGRGTVNELIAFAIRSGEAPVAYEKLTYYVCNDGIHDPNRTVKIAINPVFVPEYGYTINDRYFKETITVGNDDAGGEPCEGAVVVDTPSIVLSETSLTVPEGGTGTYDVTLSSEPSEMKPSTLNGRQGAQTLRYFATTSS